MALPTCRTVCFALALAASGDMAQAIGVVDAPADYLAGFTGSKKGDLDVLGAFVTYNPSTDMFVLSGTMNADVGSSAGGFYVWGVNRGAGTARFAANGVGGVLFDAVVILRPDGTGAVTDLLTGPPPTTKALKAGNVVSVGTTILAKVDGSMLASTGFAKTDYTWNLWPRDGSLPAGFGAISDFAPNNTNFRETVIGQVPEPSGVLLMGFGLAALAGIARRRPR